MITIDNQKQCTKCKEFKPATDGFFGNRKMGSLGLKPQCKACDSGDARKWYEANRGQVISNSLKWYEANPERHKGNSRKWREANPERYKENKLKWREANPEKVKELNRKWYEANPERHKENRRKWHEANPEKGAEGSLKRRALIANATGTATANQIKARFQYHENRCYYCGDNESGLHVEHRIPLSRGGSNWPANLVPACPTCNLSKHTKTEKEFLKS